MSSYGGKPVDPAILNAAAQAGAGLRGAGAKDTDVTSEATIVDRVRRGLDGLLHPSASGAIAMTEGGPRANTPENGQVDINSIKVPIRLSPRAKEPGIPR